MGVFLYYSWAVNSTMLTALSKIASAQAEPIKDTIVQCWQFFDCTATHHNATITFKKSDMVLVVHSNASYFSTPKARSHAGRHFSCLPTLLTLKIMVRSSTLPNSSGQSCPPLPKLNLALSIAMHVKPSHNESHSKIWDTSNPLCQSKPTTAQH